MSPIRAAALTAMEVSMPAAPRSSRGLFAFGSPVRTTALLFVVLPVVVQGAAAAEATVADPPIEQQVQALAPSLEDYIAANMKSFDVPGLAIGIVAGDKLIYAK